MGTCVAGAASARSLELCGDESSSSSQFWKLRRQEFAARAQRHAFALGASREDVLMAAAERASDRLKHDRPEFSAATLSKLACCIPLLFGIAALIALLNSASTVALCAIVVLPAAFRVLVVASPARRPWP